MSPDLRWLHESLSTRVKKVGSNKWLFAILTRSSRRSCCAKYPSMGSPSEQEGYGGLTDNLCAISRWRVPHDVRSFRNLPQGAPEMLMACSATLSVEVRERTARFVESMAREGKRCIGVARSQDVDGQGMELVGVLAFEDPVRGDAGDAVARLEMAGIRLIMVTGNITQYVFLFCCSSGSRRSRGYGHGGCETCWLAG